MHWNPVKGINFLVKAGALEAKPAGIARFLKEQGGALDPTAVGEYIGHHDALPVRPPHHGPPHTHHSQGPARAVTHLSAQQL